VDPPSVEIYAAKPVEMREYVNPAGVRRRGQWRFEMRTGCPHDHDSEEGEIE
jgi:hypothetical protein